MNYAELFSLRGKTAVVTGGAGLLGREICRALADCGAHVFMADIDQKKADELIAGDAFKGLSAEYLPFDITDTGSIDRGIARAVRSKGAVDIFINSGYPRTADWGEKFEDIPAESLKKNVDMHLNGYILSSQRVLKQMKAQKNGVLINIGSIYGVLGPNFSVYEGTPMTMPAAYAAIKGGIVNFSRYCATYYAKDNIRVNAVCPGGVFNGQNPSFVTAYEKLTPLGRMAAPQDIAGPIVFLCSDAAAYITGQVLMVDGGWSSW